MSVSVLSADESSSYNDLLPAEDTELTDAQPLVFALRFTASDENGTHEVAPASAVAIELSGYAHNAELASIFAIDESGASRIAGPVSAGSTLSATTDKAVFAFTQASTAEAEAASSDHAKTLSADKKSELFKSLVESLNGSFEATPDAETEAESQAANEPVRYPAVQLTGAAAGVNVAVNAPEGALPAGVQLSVTEVSTPAAVLEDANASAEDAISLDVHFYLPEDPETEIEPQKAVVVSFSNINLDAETVDVYHEEDKIAQTSGEGGTLALDQFSTYTFVKSEEGSPIVEQTSDEATQLTVHNLNLELKSGETASIDLKTDRTVAEYKNTNPSSPNYGTVYDLNPNTWDVSVNGTSVEVSDDFVLTAVGLGSSEVTLTHKAIEDDYWDKPDIKLTATFTVNVVAKVTYDGNGANEAPYTTTYTSPAPVLDANSFTKPNRYFLGWSTDPNATAPEFQPGDDILGKELYGKTVYAVWQTIQKVVIHVNRVWDDDNNRDGMRGDTTYSIVGTASDGTEVARRSGRVIPANSPVDKKQDTGKADDLTTDFYTATTDGPITYTLEVTAPDGYTATVTDNGNGDFTITDTHEPEKYGPISVTKVWDDDSDRDGKRPENVTVQIKRDTETVRQSTITDGTKVLAESNTKPELAYYKYHDGGQPYTYTLVERDVPEGYEATIAGDVENGFTITNTYKPETIQVKVSKVWDDADDQDGKRPAEITLHLVGTVEGEEVARRDVTWQMPKSSSTITKDNTLKDPLYKYYKGKEISYAVTEDEVAEYDTTVTGDVASGFTVTNTHEPEQRTLTVTKSWEAEENGDTTRRSDVTVTVMADGTPINEQMTLTEADSWVGTLEVDKYRDHGVEIDYTVEEQDVPFYRNDGVTGDMESGFTLHNTYIPNETTVTINKVWDDLDNADGTRPDVAYLLLMNNGEVVREARVRAADNWTTTFTDVPVFADQTDPDSIIDYRVEEDNNAGYVVNVVKEGDAIDGYTYTVTNTKTDAGLISIPVTKVWDDASNQDGKRPETVEVTLRSAGGTVDTITLDAASSWKGKFVGVPSVDPETGEEIEYNVVESAVEGYEEPVIEGSAADGFTITNKHVPETFNIEIDKFWDDAENQDGKRPEGGVRVTLFANGVSIDQGDFQGALTNEELYFNDLPVYANGEKIVYTVAEQSIEGYTADYEYRPMAVDPDTGANRQVIAITNTYKPEMRTITVVKVWDDDNDQDGLRKDLDYVTVKLLADGQEALDEFDEPIFANISEDNGWSATFDVPVYAPNGQKIAYTVEEEGVPEGYEVSYSDLAESGFITITNKHNPAVVQFRVGKEWVDDNNRDGIRPESVTYYVTGYELQSDGSAGTQILHPTREITLTAKSSDTPNHWVTNFDMPKYGHGSEILYVLEEQLPAGYTSDQESILLKPYIDWQGMVIGEEQFFTNTHEPELVEINVEKVWNDNNDQDGVRPDSVRAFVYANGTYAKRQAQLSESGNWTATIASTASTKLYKYENGQEINYTVVESQSGSQVVPVANYSAEVTGSVEEGFTITNTHEPATGSLTVIKEWNDNENQDGFRPDSLQVTLSSNADPDLDDDRGLSAANGWTYTWDNLPVYADGEPIEYTVTEVKDGAWVEHYEIDESSAEGIDLISGDDAIIVNTHEPETMTIEVWKDWDDEGNYDKKRPQAILYTIFADGVAYKDGVMTESDAVGGLPDSWSVTIEDVPVYQNGKKVAYTLVEDPVDDYTTTVSTKIVEEGFYPNRLVFLVTNTYEPGMTTVSVQKTWDDNNNQDGIRPEKLTAKLQFRCPADNMNDWLDHPAGTVELNAENSWTGSWDVHTQRVETSSDLEFRVIETEVPEGYTESYAKKDGVWTITNKHVPETGLIAIQKVWDDDNNRDGKRPSSVTFDIVGSYQEADGTLRIASRTELVLNDNTAAAEDAWMDVIELPKYKDGYEITYEASEHAVPEYEPQGAIAEDGTIDLQYLNVDDISTINEVTNKHVPELVEINVEKVWNDANNQDGIRPESIRVFVSANGEHVRQRELSEANGWKTTIAAETQYKYENGKEIVYTIDESTSGSELVPVEGYEKTIEGSVADGFTITNTHEPLTGDITFIKNWDDANNQDGLRPERLRVTLTTSEPIIDPETGETTGYAETGSTDAIVTAANGWTYTWKDLPAYNNGQFILYTITEEQVDGYECTPTSNSTTLENGGEVTLELTNTHTPEVVNIEVVKIWDDASNQDGKRPSEGATITLLADGVSVDQGVFQGADDVETIGFQEQPVYANGKKIVYSVVERAIDNYTADVEARPMFVDPGEDPDDPSDDFNKQVFEVTNSYKPEMTTLTVVKVWNDEDDYDGIRPSSVDVSLYAGTEPAVDESGDPIVAVLDQLNGWMATFDVPAYKDGVKINYSVLEDNVPEGYEATYSDLAESGYFTITNTHVPELTRHTVTINWNDNDNQDGQRPEYVNVYLMNNGERTEHAPVTLSAANGWTYTWENLPAGDYSTGTEVPNEYAADEITPLTPASYTQESVQTDAETKTTTIVNAYEPKTMTVSGHKIWDDNSNQDGKRPEKVTINLFADGDLVQSKEISAADAVDENTWAYSFTDLPRYIDGQLVHYNVSEAPVANYSLTIKGYDLVNTYTPGQTFTTVIKLWNDDRDRDGIRPENVIVRLLANGEEVNRASISAASGWFTVFSGLPVNENGTAVEYTVTEDAVDGYTAEITGSTTEGFVVTNTHEVELTEVSVTKLWDDNNNALGKRPSNITVNLLAGGTIVSTKVLTAQEGWKATFTELPKNAAGQPIAYTVAEAPVPGYTATVSGTTITNKLVCPDRCVPCPTKGGGKMPATGDPASFGALAAVVAGAATTLTVAVKIRKRDDVA